MMQKAEIDTVLSAAHNLVQAFARHDKKAYFAAFAPEATFIFHSTPTMLPSRAAYEALWDQWERDIDFRVLKCSSTEAGVQLIGEVAIFRHRVQTILSTRDGEIELTERETIVFQRTAQGTWLAVHEHLSPATT